MTDKTSTYLLAENGANGLMIKSMRVFMSYAALKEHVGGVYHSKWSWHSAWEGSQSEAPRRLSKVEKIDIGLVPRLEKSDV